jgi:hypothetical protein
MPMCQYDDPDELRQVVMIVVPFVDNNNMER